MLCFIKLTAERLLQFMVGTVVGQVDEPVPAPARRLCPWADGDVVTGKT